MFFIPNLVMLFVDIVLDTTGIIVIATQLVRNFDILKWNLVFFYLSKCKQRHRLPELCISGESCGSQMLLQWSEQVKIAGSGQSWREGNPEPFSAIIKLNTRSQHLYLEQVNGVFQLVRTRPTIVAETRSLQFEHFSVVTATL